jgi:hypothetical protein
MNSESCQLDGRVLSVSLLLAEVLEVIVRASQGQPETGLSKV